MAVSKLKSAELIIKAYKYGQRHFGENYVQELIEKSNDNEVIEITFINHVSIPIQFILFK